MKILVFSDTHRSHSNVINIINYDEEQVDAVIHCGDIIRDCEEIERNISPKIPFIYVCGNNDYYNNIVPDDKSITLGGKKIFITHGHKYGVKQGKDSLRRKIKEGYDIVLYGHTHISDIEYFSNGILLNPGAMAYGAISYGVIEIKDNKVYASIVKK